MLIMGFSLVFVSRVMVCVMMMSYFILVLTHKGPKASDPISPFLFPVYIKGLLRSIYKETDMDIL